MDELYEPQAIKAFIQVILYHAHTKTNNWPQSNG
jgi:hypothetical protein